MYAEYRSTLVFRHIWPTAPPVYERLRRELEALDGGDGAGAVLAVDGDLQACALELTLELSDGGPAGAGLQGARSSLCGGRDGDDGYGEQPNCGTAATKSHLDS